MRRTTLLLGCTLAGALPLGAQASARRDSALTSGTAFHIHSKVLGEDRPYFLYAPPGGRGGRLPIIVVLDGDAHFDHTASAVRFLVNQGRMPPALVVAVPNTADRTRDLTPAVISDTALRTATPTAGGADRLLRFLADELIPAIERRHGKAPFRVLVGHSLGGLTAAYALLGGAGGFQAVIAISPSLWWDHERLTDSLVARLARQPPLQGWWYATMGALESADQMIAPFQRVERALREHAPATLQWRFTLLPDEDHGSTPYRSAYDGLEAIFRPYRVPTDSMVALGIDGLDRRYAELRARFGFPERTPEVAFNTLGYLLLADSQAPRRAQALEAFRENARRFPRSANVYDSLGDGFLTLGDKASAFTCFAASVLTGRKFPDEGGVVPGRTIAPQSLVKLARVALDLGRQAWVPDAIPEQVTALCPAGPAR